MSNNNNNDNNDNDDRNEKEEKEDAVETPNQNGTTTDDKVLLNWSAFYDDEGRLYYYNSVTDESSWDPPAEGYNPPPPPEEEEETTAVKDVEQTSVKDDDEEEHTEETNATTTTTTTIKDDRDSVVVTDELPGEETTAEEQQEQEQQRPEWMAYQDEEGQEYYYNTVTGETQWEKPDAPIQPYQEEDQDEAVATTTAATTIEQEEENALVAMEETDDLPHHSKVADTATNNNNEDDEEEDTSAKPRKDTKQTAATPFSEPEEEIDPAVQRALDAKAALERPDSVLEPGCMDNVTELVTSQGGNPQMAVNLLVDSYQGQTAICGLLSRWLVDMRTVPSSSSSLSAAATSGTNGTTTITTTTTTTTTSVNSPSTIVTTSATQQALADEIRTTTQDVIYKIVKERFTKEAGDSILDLSKSEAAFLEEMMDSPRWRRLLIDLSATHKKSVMLMYCLKAISKRGHHREIAKRVNQSEHFAVFNAMLLSELTTIGNLSISAGSDPTLAIGLHELVDDLRRANSSTSYTYLYSVEMLRYLVDKLKRDQQPAPGDRLGRVLRKWEALCQDLESTMMDPSVSSSVAGASSLFRKRRLEVALTISDLHQRQRKRQRPRQQQHHHHHHHNHENGGHSSNGHDGNVAKLETSLLTFLRRYSIGIQVDAAVLDALLPQGLDLNTAAITGRLLNEHPLAIRALYGHLYKPGSTRVNNPVIKNKCARLLALAVVAAEKSSQSELPENEDGEEPEVASDEVALTRMILDGSQICEQLESMVSFLVTTESTNPSIKSAALSSSPGQKICQLALKCAAVAQGVMMWAHERTRGPEFAASASFPTLSVSILSLVRIVSMHHPFTRREALQIGLNFLHHSNPDISYQKVSAIKEQSLRMLIFLLVKGEVIPVLSSITARLQGQGSSDMDASLVRYFVSGVLEVVRAPVSVVFVRTFGALLLAPKCMDAIKSSYFVEPHKSRLTALLQSFPSLTAMDGSALPADEENFIAALLATYSVASS